MVRFILIFLFTISHMNANADICGVCNSTYLKCLANNGSNCDENFRSCNSSCRLGAPANNHKSDTSHIGSIFSGGLIIVGGLFVGGFLSIMAYLFFGQKIKTIKNWRNEKKRKADPKLNDEFIKQEKLESLRWRAYRMTINEMSIETGLEDKIVRDWLNMNKIKYKK